MKRRFLTIIVAILCSANFICATEVVEQTCHVATAGTIESGNEDEDTNDDDSSGTVDESLDDTIDCTPYILFLILAAGVGYLFYSRKLLEYNPKTIETLKQGLKDQSKKNLEIDGLLSTVKQELSDLQSENETLKKTITSLNRYNESVFDRKTQTVTVPKDKDSITLSASKSVDSKKAVEIIRYAMFYQGTSGNFTIPARAIKENSQGQWFVISFIEGDGCGTYTINPGCKSEMLNDLTSFRMYVENFNTIPAPKDIQVVTPGKLVKKENVWEISEKMTIQLS